MSNKYTSQNIVDRLKKKYKSSEGYILLEQVSNGTGFSRAKSWIDCAVFATWPSLGLVRSAYEIKVERGDFLSELQNAKKNQWARAAFHFFWFVAPDGVIKEEELPENCGWMKPRGEDGLTIVRHAAKRENPELDDLLLNAFVRSAVKDLSSMKQAAVRNALDNSHEFQEAKYYRDAARKFIKERGQRDFSLSAADAYETLVKCTLDKSVDKDVKHLMHQLNNFQDQMLDMLSSFALLSQHSLIAKNELGAYITKTFGTIDKGSLEELKKRAKKRGYDCNHAQELVQLQEFLSSITGTIPSK